MEILLYVVFKAEICIYAQELVLKGKKKRVGARCGSVSMFVFTQQKKHQQQPQNHLNTQ